MRGREPGETHYHVYDEDGRLVSTRVERDPEWTPDQLAVALAIEANDRTLGPHGHPIDEATSPEADPMNRRGSYAYKAGVLTTTPEGLFVYAPLIDFAQKAGMDAEDKWREAAGPNANSNGMTWPITRVEREQRSPLQ